MSPFDYFCLAVIAVAFGWALWANREIHHMPVARSMAHRKGGRMGRGPR